MAQKRKLPKILSQDEVDGLMKAPNLHAPTGLRNRCMLELMYRAGLRVGETVALRPRDVDLATGTVRIFDGKTGDGTAYFDLAVTAELLERWKRRRRELPIDKESPLFCTHERAVASLVAEAEAATATATDLGTRRASLRTEALRLDDTQKNIVIPGEPEGLRAANERLLELARVPVDLATVRERIAGLEQTISQTDNDEYRDTARRLSFELTEAEQQLAAIAQPEPRAADHARAAALQAKAAAEAHASRARTASERLAAVSALLEQAEAAQTEHAEAVAERDRLHAELDILTRLEQAFGRDGIPAWIVESQALPQIESEANRMLSRLGGAISRVELRTERETRSGALRDALDIVCLTDDGERALETFSGGEQSRAEIALALGLVDVLANRRGADLRYLALDEPSGLDSQGTEALAEILRERAGSVVLLASHDPGLRDQFDQSVLVQRGPQGSEVIA